MEGRQRFSDRGPESGKQGEFSFAQLPQHLAFDLWIEEEIAEALSVYEGDITPEEFYAYLKGKYGGLVLDDRQKRDVMNRLRPADEDELYPGW
jgi:hypothetical protein